MRRSVLAGLVLFASGAGLALGAQAQSTEPAGPPPSPLPAFLELGPRVATGGQPTAEGLRKLAADGFQAVVNIRTSAEKANLAAEESLVSQLGLKYFMVPFSGREPSEKQALAFLQVMNALKGEKVFVHCAAANRVGVLMMVHLALQEGVPPAQAEETGKRIGMRPSPLVDFARKMIEKHTVR